MKKHETGVDVVRTTALVFVVSVHYFLNNGFYSRPMEGFSMMAAGCFRWLFFTCVPLFLLITGYLRGDDLPSGQYYCGVFRVVFSWLFISVISIGIWNGYMGMQKSVASWIGYILDYKSANYSWYVEMYLGAFLIFPYINLAFHRIETRNGHRLMVASFCAVTFLPSLLNGWRVGDSVWNFVPDYWISLYPFAYYVIGCYIRRYRPDPPPALCVGAAGLICVLKGVLTYVTAAGKNFGDGLGGGYSDFFVCAASVFLFLGLYRIRLSQNKKSGKTAAGLFRMVSSLSLEAYLISWVFDKPLYDAFASRIVPGKYLQYYMVLCMPILILSLIAAWPVNRLSCRLAGLLKSAVHAWRIPAKTGRKRI